MPDPTPLEMIYEKLKTLEEKMDKVITCQIDLKIQDEVLKAKLSSLELQQIQVQSDLDIHKKDMEKHYNPFYSETLKQRIWRKKAEITLGGGLGALIVGLIQFLTEVLN